MRTGRHVRLHRVLLLCQEVSGQVQGRQDDDRQPTRGHRPASSGIDPGLRSINSSYLNDEDDEDDEDDEVD